MQPRIYTYKVTFEEVPYWYWGVHKENKLNDGYLGSPKTHAWMWEFYTPRIQILEVFDYSEEGWGEAQSVEKRLIRPDLNNPLCLNERCGGNISLAAKSLGGKSAKREDKSKAGKNGSREDKSRAGQSGNREGKARGGAKSGKANGEENVRLGRGAMNLEGRRKGSQAQHKIRVRCLVTGKVSTLCGLTKYQRARNIDTSLRERVHSPLT
jgi:hypothetical protein